jgi:peptidoglycan/xylan/chitin deacetylase (PgdA/CDA1 family)
MIKLLKNCAKAVISPVLDATGLYERRIHRAGERPGVWTIVMYHRVIDDPASDPFELGMCVSRDRFEAQVRMLVKHFQVLTVGDACARLARGEPLPARALSITFDDGYLDNLTLALPVLQRHGAPWSLYVPSGGWDGPQAHWWDRAIAAMGSTERETLNLHAVGLSPTHEEVALKGVMAAPGVERVLDALWALDWPTCQDRLARLEQWCDVKRTLPALAAPRCSTSQLRQLHQAGVEMGAHSITHQNLAMAAPDEVLHEMVDSRQALEDLLQTEIRGFAHPGGREHAQAEGLARRAGFTHVLSTRSGVNQPRHETMALRRIGMPNAGPADFRRAFSGALLKAGSGPAQA